MPRCVLLVSGADHDVTNLLTEAQLIEFMSRSSTSCCLTDDNEDQAQAQTQAQAQAENDSTITLEEVLREYEQYQAQQAQHLQQQQAHDWSTCSALYPNLNDPCNKRMIQDLPPLKWEAVPLVRQVDHSTSGQSQEQADKFAEFYDLQQRDLERLQQQHHLQQQLDLQEQAEADFDMTMTSLPQRAYSAPLHTPAGGLAPVSPHHTLSHMNAHNPYNHNHSVINHSHNHMMMNMNMNDNHSVMPPSFTAQTTMGSVFPRSSVHHRFGGGDDGDGTHSLASPHRRHSPPRPSLPPVRRQQRHSTTAVPGDIESSSSGLRPRVNYKALYGRRGSSASSAATPPNLETSLSGFSMGGASIDDDGASMMSGGGSGGGQHHHHHHHDQDGAGCMMEESTTTATTMMDSSSLHQMPHHHHHHHHYHHHHHQHPVMEEDDEEEPVPQEDHSESAPARTMEIAPNVHVQVRSSQETYKAVQSGDYTVATCFACCATIVCVNDAAYVLCPDCQVVSPLGFGAATNDASKKDDPYGIGTGLKREWVDEHVR